jgi:hypothetical protein
MYPAGRECISGLPSNLISITAANGNTAQEQSQWCWAACISMVFGFYGVPVSQARIVAEAYGGLVNMPAQPWTILASLNRVWVADNNRRFLSQSSPGNTNAVLAAQDLAGNHPLILGTLGHAVVLTSLKYAAPYQMTAAGPQLGPAGVNEAVVRDPWPGQGRRALSGQEWNSIMFAAQIRVQLV